jgi:hypothetical protein
LPFDRVVRNTMRLDEGLFKWTKCIEENESTFLMLVLLHLFL